MIEKEINDFINNNLLATICCSTDNAPYCFNCMYATIEKDGYLVFKSSPDTKHTDILMHNNKVAGPILPKKFEATAIRGIQFEGIAVEDEDSLAPATSAYYAKYPIAMAMPGKIWIVELLSIKFTDNTKGFGYKRVWSKYEETFA